jgi:CubicO group peptidase (beta-lactamase class C family)
MKKVSLFLAFQLFAVFCFSQINTSAIDSIMNSSCLPNEPGAAIVITKGGKEIYAKGFGMANLELEVPMTSEMIFRIASITKQFTAVSILLLEERSKLKISDDFRKYLPDYPDYGKVITIEHLLTNTSGIPDYTGFPNHDEISQTTVTTSEILDIFKDKPLEFEPGEHYSYSSSGYNILGAIIEGVSGMTYEEFVETEIFEKLGMHNSFYDHPEEIVKNKILGYVMDSLGYRRADYITMSDPFSAGALSSTVHDLAVWNKSIHDGKLISVENLARAFKPYKLNSGELSSYGFGWDTHLFLGHQLYHHSGRINGFRTNGFYFPKEDIYIAILSNNSSIGPRNLSLFIASELLGESSKKAIKLDKTEILNLIGTYANSERTIKITEDSNKLFFDISWANGELITSSKNEFYVNGTHIGCTFDHDSTGMAKSISVKHRFFGHTAFTLNREKPLSNEYAIVEELLEEEVRQNRTMTNEEINKLIGDYGDIQLKVENNILIQTFEGKEYSMVNIGMDIFKIEDYPDYYLHFLRKDGNIIGCKDVQKRGVTITYLKN